MSLYGFGQALQVGNDVRFAVKFSKRRWRRVHMALGDKWQVCPFCGQAVPDDQARKQHESFEARQLTLMAAFGVWEPDEGEHWEWLSKLGPAEVNRLRELLGVESAA